MPMIIVYAILALAIIAVFIYALIIIEHKKYVKIMAGKYSIDFVNKMILDDELAISNCGESPEDIAFIDTVLDHQTLWKEVRECKLKNSAKVVN